MVLSGEWMAQSASVFHQAMRAMLLLLEPRTCITLRLIYPQAPAYPFFIGWPDKGGMSKSAKGSGWLEQIIVGALSRGINVIEGACNGCRCTSLEQRRHCATSASPSGHLRLLLPSLQRPTFVLLNIVLLLCCGVLVALLVRVRSAELAAHLGVLLFFAIGLTVSVNW